MEIVVVAVIVTIAFVLLVRQWAGKAGLGLERPDCGCGTCATKRKEKH